MCYDEGAVGGDGDDDGLVQYLQQEPSVRNLLLLCNRMIIHRLTRSDFVVDSIKAHKDTICFTRRGC